VADRATDIVILGTGGSSLGGQTLAQLAGFGVPGVGAFRPPPQLHFIDNLDPDSFETLLARLPHATTRFVAISKSGGTAETLMQTIAALSALREAGLQTRIPDIFLGISEPSRSGKTNGLRDLLGKFRSSHARSRHRRRRALFSADECWVAAGSDAGPRHCSGALTARLSRWRQFSRRSRRRRFRQQSAPRFQSVSARANGKPSPVLMAYCDRLQRFTHWYVQLWAESLGKHSKGTTPVAALGPVDQHSQLQLFISGPRDKLFTVITTDGAGSGPSMDGDLAKLAGEPGFAGKSIGDLVAAEGRATAETLAKNGCPVRTIHISRLDEAALGELMMHFMLETIIRRASSGRRSL
jgi:glucose-6-phosphate isomerase